MKLPSLTHLARQTAGTVARFPFETLAAFTGTVAAICDIESDYSDPNRDLYPKILITAMLALAVFLSGSLLSERLKLSGIKKWGIQLILTGLLTGYYFTLSAEPSHLQMLRHFVLDISFHLLISFIAVGGSLTLAIFWQFNRILFIRILTALLYSGVLFAGLAGALAAIDNLFAVNIKGDHYGWLFSIIAGIFNTIFFLAGVPSQEEIVTTEDNYPKGLKTFTQFVLIPIVCIYLIILLAYECKIVATFNLPYGWVSYLILWYAIGGILSTLLVYPIRNAEEHKWINTFSKWFYVTLIPLTALLYWAILYRINKYGITEERYYVLVLAIWLTFILFYFLFNSKQNIRLIPITLCAIGLLSAYGPISASFVSEKSQLHRFEAYVEQSKTDTLSVDDKKQMRSILEYMLPNYGTKSMNSVLNHAFDTLTVGSYLPASNSDSIMVYLGITPLEDNNEYGGSTTFSLQNPHLIDIRGYQYQFHTAWNNSFYNDGSNQSSSISQEIQWQRTSSGIYIKDGKDWIRINPALHYRMLYKKYGQTKEYSTTCSPDDMTQRFSSSSYDVAVIYTEIQGAFDTEDSLYTIENFEANVLLKVK
jgi:hypothetical protein